jgi:carbonic anhydrase
MTAIDNALKMNATYAERFKAALRPWPSPKLTIVTCMDPRLNDIVDALGFTDEEAEVIRNAGSSINEDAIRSLLVSTRILGSKEIMIVNHTDCPMLTITDKAFESKLVALSDAFPIVPARFYTFTDLEEDTREQIKRARGHPWISSDIPVRGFIYDVNSRRLTEVTA